MKPTAAFVFIRFLFVSCVPKKEVIQPPKETKMLPPPAPETQPFHKKHLQTVTCEENTADMFNKSGMELLPFVRLYTDGVTDATDDNEQPMDRERLLDLLQANLHKPAQETANNLLAGIQAYQGKNPQFDDITLIEANAWTN